MCIRDRTMSVAPGRPPTEGQVKATVDVEGRDVREAVASLVPAPAVSGPIKGRLQISGTAARLTATGAVAFERLTVSQSQPRCPDPKPRSLVLDDVRMPHSSAPPQLDSPAVHSNAATGPV